MGTKIEWCDETWNPITGCTPISEGCKNCYAERMTKRLAGRFGYPRIDPFSPAMWHEDQLNKPLKWKKPRKVFVCSMGDIFHDDVYLWQIDAILEVISACPQHTFLLLTKRPENIDRKIYTTNPIEPCRELGGGDYLPNVWIGVTVENQKQADIRTPELLKSEFARLCPVRFVSVEPMLGSVQFAIADGLDWVICGGETGPGARLMRNEWVLYLLNQCKTSDVPFFFKQWGTAENRGYSGTIDGKIYREFPKERR